MTAQEMAVLVERLRNARMEGKSAVLRPTENEVVCDLLDAALRIDHEGVERFEAVRNGWKAAGSHDGTGGAS